MTWNDLFGDKIFNRKLFSLAFPITMQSLMLALVAAADAIMLGKVSQDAMAAVSLATQIQFVQNMLLVSIASGIGVLGAQYWGKKDKKVLGQIFGQTVREALLVSVIFFAGCFWVPEMLMKAFAGDEKLISIGADYLRVASWSYLLTGVSQCYLAVMRVSDHAPRSAWISSGAVILNIILNAVFIFGCFGIPAMGVCGAALATVVARIIELLWCVASTFEKNFIPLKIKDLCTFNWRLTADFWRYTAPILGSCLLWGIGFTSYTAIMGHLGPDAAAANAISAVVRDLICCLCNGIAAGAGIMIGNELGAGNLELGKKYGDRAMIYSFIIGCISALIVLASIPLVSRYMDLTEQAHKYMIGMFLILALYMIGRCVCTIVINGIFASGGDTLFDVYSLIVFMWFLALPCAFISAFYLKWSVLIVFACTCLDEVGKVPWVVYHFKRYKWVKNITRD